MLPRETFLKHKVVQGNHSVWMFGRYFQIFHSVGDQLSDLLPWDFLVIVDGCPCVFGAEGGVFYPFQFF